MIMKLIPVLSLAQAGIFVCAEAFPREQRGRLGLRRVADIEISRHPRESAMQDPTARIIAILKQYTRDLGFPVASWTRFAELGIDRLDLPLIVLDIEDAFAIQIGYDQQMDGFASVGDLIACVRAHLAMKGTRVRSSAPRSKRPWMSKAA
jgi:acyl carrier protein